MICTAPDGPPNDLKVVSTNLTAINITWTPVNCTQQNSVIKGYTVHYRKISVEIESRYTDDTNAIIVKLDPNTEYVLEVQAVNDENMTGPLAELIVNTSIPEGKDSKINYFYYLGSFYLISIAVGFLLNNHQYDNNSVVASSDIGEAVNGLLCLTNNTKCCLNDNSSDWFLPNGDKVQAGEIIFVDRGPNMVRLNRRNNASLPVGIFRCSILNVRSTRQDIYIGVYPIGSGQGVVRVKDLILDESEQALLCISTGGPPTTVHWMKDGQPLNSDGATYKQRQIIANANSSTYITTLLIHPVDRVQTKVIGTYTCRVSNSRVISPGKNQQKDFEIQGKFTIIITYVAN